MLSLCDPTQFVQARQAPFEQLLITFRTTTIFASFACWDWFWCECMCVHGWACGCECVSGGQWVMWRVFLGFSLPYTVKQALSLEPRAANSARPGSQLALLIPFLPSVCTCYRRVRGIWYPAFMLATKALCLLRCLSRPLNLILFTYSQIVCYFMLQ